MNKDCKIGDILAEYIIPIMQILTNELPEYNMKMKTTKCLNVAIMITIFMLGRVKGKEIIDYCDSKKTKEQKYYVNNIIELNNTFNDILKIEDGRYLYYILLADGVYKDKDNNTLYFPGHVFLIEKYDNNYKLYQSYIKQYDLQEYKNKVQDFSISKEKIKNIINHLLYIITKTKTWDDNCVKYWNEFTFVDTENNFKGAIIENNMHICILKSRIDGCLKNLKKFIKDNIKQIKDIDTIYGNVDYYDLENNPKKVLTSKELKENLNTILRKI